MIDGIIHDISKI